MTYPVRHTAEDAFDATVRPLDAAALGRAPRPALSVAPAIPAGRERAARPSTRHVFPSVDWFRAVGTRMTDEPDRYRDTGVMDVTLVPRIRLPDGAERVYVLEFRGYELREVSEVGTAAEVTARHAVCVDGHLAAWRAMIENIARHGGADSRHTLNSLTLHEWPLRLVQVHDGAGQLELDRFYRFLDGLQQFFDGSAGLATEFAEP
ncbi:MAG TPA: hypothetical protein VFD92_24400 [Candidatus Binatia bacterium]|nr:hypothetical protein [Candidatus Binatia bacterium]